MVRIHSDCQWDAWPVVVRGVIRAKRIESKYQQPI
jgi:hypothetical protein